MRREEMDILFWLLACEAFGSTPASVGIERCHAVLAEATDVQVEWIALNFLGLFEAMQERFDEARRCWARSYELRMELGQRLGAEGMAMVGGLDRAPCRRPARSRERAPTVVRGSDAMGETAYLSTAAGVLAEALYLQGRYHEAEEWTRTSEQTASPEDTASQIEWRTVWAKLLARRGAFGEAESLACAAVAIGRETDDPRTLADALLGFAEVLELAGREGEAFPLIEEALGLYQRKEILPSVERARARLAALQAPPATA